MSSVEDFIVFIPETQVCLLLTNMFLSNYSFFFIRGLEDGMKKRAGLLFNIFRKFCLASLHPHSPSSFVSLAQVFYQNNSLYFYFASFFYIRQSHSNNQTTKQLSSDLLQKLIPKMADEVEEAHLASRATVLVFSVIAICASSGLFLFLFYYFPMILST